MQACDQTGGRCVMAAERGARIPMSRFLLYSLGLMKSNNLETVNMTSDVVPFEGQLSKSVNMTSDAVPFEGQLSKSVNVTSDAVPFEGQLSKSVNMTSDAVPFEGQLSKSVNVTWNSSV